MVHPLAQLNHLTDTELQEKLDDLNKKYWMASNPDVRNQIVLMLDSLKLEQENRYKNITTCLFTILSIFTCINLGNQISLYYSSS